MVIPPIDYKANFESDVWNAFYAMGAGHKMLLTGEARGPIIYAIRHSPEHANFYVEPRIMNVLISKGIAEETTEDAGDKVDTVYRLTEKGHRLFEEMEAHPDSEKLQMLISRIDLKYERGR